MVKWLSLDEEQRMNTLKIVSGNTNGLPLAAIEKDWWVTAALRAMFNSEYSENIVFKGGTSLSKAWNLIERFSEDVDVIIGREVLGFDNDDYSKTRVKKLKRAACAFTSNELLKAINNMTRHLYDIEKIMDTEHGVEALEDKELFESIVEHRKIFNLKNYVDHNLYDRHKLNFIPSPEIIGQWDEDYKQMQTSMFMGGTLSFENLIKRLEELKERFSAV